MIKMDAETSVFQSKVPIKQIGNPELDDLLNTPQVKPITANVLKSEVTNTFKNDSAKIYVPPKMCKKKVKTVQQIRKEFEESVYETLTDDLEKQHKYIFDKIRRCSAQEEILQERGKKLLKSSNPLKKLTWQMLTNMNPDNNKFAKQYVLLNSKPIVINGSAGGSKKFICNFDLEPKKLIQSMKKKIPNRQIGLLKTSLSVRFKPGPLTKKKQLDASFQKFTLGTITPVLLPEIGIEITSTPGAPIDSRLYGYIQSFREVDGKMTDEWVNFATSLVESRESCNEIVTFKLKYKNEQKRILMRKFKNNPKTELCNYTTESTVQKHEWECNKEEILSVMNDIICAVEINISQNDLLSYEDEAEKTERIDKERIHQKQKESISHPELKKLAVSVIRVADNSLDESKCEQSFCRLGCICASLQCNYQLKTHCSQVQCMFKCQCDLKKSSSSICDDYSARFINFDKNLRNKLAKVEKEFHQTVVLTENKSIVLSSGRRCSRLTKKYADYIDSLHGKQSVHKKELSIVTPFIDCRTIEPWCMVHELYRCFCKGKFVTKPELTISDRKGSTKLLFLEIDDYHMFNLSTTDTQNIVIDETNLESDEDTLIDVVNVESPSPQEVFQTENISNFVPSEGDLVEVPLSVQIMSCARSRPFLHLKNKLPNRETPKVLTKDVSSKTNIMSKTSAIIPSSKNNQNVKTLRQMDLPQQKPRNLKHKIGHSSTLKRLSKSSNSNNVTATNETQIIQQSDSSTENLKMAEMPSLFSKNFANWLEKRYGVLARRLNNGKHLPLEPPTLNKMSLYPWNSLIHRVQRRSNFVLVQCEPPLRVIITIDPSNPDFKDYVDVYTLTPDTVRIMPEFVAQIINRKENTESFALLHGSRNYWQILGLVKKNGVNLTPKLQSCLSTDESELNNENTKILHEEDTTVSADDSVSYNKSSIPQTDFIQYSRYQDTNLDKTKHDNKITTPSIFVDENNSNNKSKWFVMTVENDFEQLQFKTKNFVVTFKTIMSAIKLARSSGQTVILPLSKIKTRDEITPQFGIYAMPDNKKTCVFIGPYEIDDNLEMNTIKGSNTPVSKEHTRGIWLYTKKIHNSNIIENPLHYIANMSNNKYNSVSIKTPIGNSENFALNETEEPIKKLENLTQTSSESSFNLKEKTMLSDNKPTKNKINTQLKSANTTKPKSDTSYVETNNHTEADKINPSITESLSTSTKLPTHGSNVFKAKKHKISENVLTSSKPIDRIGSDQIENNFNCHRKEEPISPHLTKKNKVEPANTVLLKSSTSKNIEANKFIEAIEAHKMKSIETKPMTPKYKSINPDLNKTKLTKEIIHENSQISPQNLKEQVRDPDLKKELTSPYKNSVIIHEGVPYEAQTVKSSNKKSLIKVIKPITVKRSNSFYRLGSFINNKASLLKSSTINTKQLTTDNKYYPLPSAFMSTPIITSVSSLAEGQPKNETVNESSSSLNSTRNITTNCGIFNESREPKKTGFIVLKPNEINNKTLSKNSIQSSEASTEHLENSITPKESCTNSTSCSDSEVYIVTDEEDDEVGQHAAGEAMIVCKNIPEIGGIPARVNARGQVSFQFPGFKFTNYYDSEEARVKLTQVFMRKVFVPKAIRLVWALERSGTREPLTPLHLLPGSMVCKTGIIYSNKVRDALMSNTTAASGGSE